MRSKIFHCFGIIIALIATTSFAQTKETETRESQQAGWSLFRGNAESTGVAQSSLPAELETLWEFKVPSGAFEGTAAIVASLKDSNRKTVYIGDLDGKFFAIDLETGKKRWEFISEIGFNTAPAVRDGLIYIGDMDGVFYCLNEAGEKVWDFKTEAEIDSSANFFNDTVLVGSQDTHLYALNAKTGKLVWKYESKDQIRCSATVADDRAFVAGCDGYFHIINLKDGSEIGSTDIKAPTGATPAVLGKRVFFGTEQGDFFAVNWQDIKNDWTHTEAQSGNSIRGSAAVQGEHVVFGGRNRQVYSLHPETGEVNWKTSLQAKIDSSPVIVGERAFVASTDGRLSALSLSDGQIVWKKQYNGGFVGSPAVAFGRLVIASDRGVVYCLGRK